MEQTYRSCTLGLRLASLSTVGSWADVARSYTGSVVIVTPVPVVSMYGRIIGTLIEYGLELGIGQRVTIP